ncbi:MAG: 30S ribosomal protein S30e [Candidatus Helarchaeota archaeon]
MSPGSHGSLTKAGKVRSQTPKVESHRIPKEIPRIRYRKNYIKKVVMASEIDHRKRRRR